jgi:glycosyltransferase involved in cell wall biosynthesis
MKEKPVISVILIAFNAAKTIARAVESICRQTFPDWELIAVDDGSTDGTTELIRQFSLRDDRIRLITASHRGTAATRQTGLDAAKGTFTIFVDADDWVEPTFLDSLSSIAEKTGADMVICNMSIIRKHGTEYSFPEPLRVTDRELIPLLFGPVHGSLCNKLIRRTCYIDNQIAFLPGLNCCEDLLVVLKLLDQGARTAYIHEPLYNYDKTGDSITNQWIDVPAKDRIRFLDAAAPIAERNHAGIPFNNYVARIAYNAIFASRDSCPNYRKLFLKYKQHILSSDLPLRKKWLIRLYLLNIRLPLRAIKLRRIKKRRK